MEEIQPEEATVKASVDVDKDGTPDANIEVKVPLPKNPKFWIVVAIVVGVIVGTKEIGLW